MTMKRKIIHDKIKQFEIYSFTGPVSKVIEFLQTLEPTDVLGERIRWGSDDESMTTYFELYRAREETDAELERRVKQEKATKRLQREQRAQHERAEYERLKKKFEKG